MGARLDQPRVPVILQAEPAGCGIACLAMLLSVHGDQTRLAEIRADCDVRPDGATVLALATAARRRGFRATAFALGARDLRRLPLPVIAHWNADHFIVVERWLPGWVDVVDPATGRQRLTPEQFQNGFSGVALVCRPASDSGGDAATSLFGFSDLVAADRGRTAVS